MIITAPPRVSPSSESVRNGRWEFLDSARGIAALLVVVQHAGERAQSVNTFCSHYLNLGEIGVVAFFLVSGYIIPASLERYGSALRFWIGRAFRLLPAYWFSLAVIVILQIAFRDESSLVLMSKPAKYLLGNLTLTQDLLHVPLALGVYWTLFYEVIFYIICTLLLLQGWLRYSRVLAIAATSVFLLGNIATALIWHHALSAEKLGIVVAAFIGTLVYRYSVGAARRSDMVVPLAIMAIGVAVANWLRLGVYASVGHKVPNGPLSGDMSFLLGFLLFGTLFVLRKRQFPPVLLWLGRVSYSVYLFHAIILWCLPTTWSAWVVVPIVLATTAGVASLTYRFVEQPALALQRRLFPHKEIVAQVETPPRFGPERVRLAEATKKESAS